MKKIINFVICLSLCSIFILLVILSILYVNYWCDNEDEKNEIIKIAIFILISFFIFVGVLALSFN